MPKIDNTPIQLILGMHRSGTSLLTQILSQSGLDVGRSLMPPSFDNPRGFWENSRIVAAHDKFLNHFKRDWTTAALIDDEAFSSKMATQTVETLARILQDDFLSSAPSLIKDPRLCVLYPLWPRVAKKLGRPLHGLRIIRSPSYVTSSIKRRNTLESDRAKFIAMSYLASLDAKTKDIAAPTIIYESLIKRSGLDVLSQLNSVLPYLDLDRRPAICQAVDRLIFRGNASDVEFPALHKIYLKSVKSTQFTLEAEAFEQVTQTCAKAVDLHAGMNMWQDEASLLPDDSTQVSVSRLRLEALTEHERQSRKTIHSLLRKIAYRDRKVGALEGGVIERDETLAEMYSQVEKHNERLGALEGGIVERDLQIKKLNRNVKTRQNKITKLVDQINSQSQIYERLRSELKETQQREQTVYANYLGLEQQKKELDTSYEFEVERARRVENQLSHQINSFRARPLRGASKIVILKVFKLIRYLLPLSGPRKLALSRHFTGIAQRLNPPAIAPITPPITLHGAGATGNTLESFARTVSFKTEPAPVISIIVPVYNEIEQTIACLRSIAQQSVSVPYEVIIADDSSPDPDHKYLADIDGARYFRNPENLGFLMNCNTNAAHAKGKYIVFLNNDTLVGAGWLDALYQTYFDHKDVGIVGSKLVFPSGDLQEAGGIIWEDASGWNWGRGENANHPRYNYVRDVDYVSGASFMIRTDIFKDIGLFYTGLEKAYYEDTDCCFRVREKGFRVMYQPLSSVMHIEGLSSGTDVTTGAKKYQAVNQKIFYDNWRHVLQDHLPNGQTPEVASDRTVRGHVLYIDSVTPEPDKDSGSVDALNAMQIVSNLGYRVHFVPGTNFAHMGAPTKALQALGIETIYHPYYANLGQFLKERGDSFDFVILSRAEINDLFLKQVQKACPRAKIIYNTVDLHFLRQMREAELSKNENAKAAAKTMRNKEIGFMRRADATIVLSAHERDILSKQKTLADKIWTIPLIRKETKRLVSYETTQNIVFIGGYGHPPNIDAVDWLMSDIWPGINQALPGVKLLLCGSHMPERFQNYASDDVVIKGYIPDLEALLSHTRLTIAPLRYGAGLKGKVASSIGGGVPCVGTSIAFEGMAEKNLDAVRHLAETPEDFAHVVASLYNDESAWTATSKAGVEYHNSNYGFSAISKTFKNMFTHLRAS